MGMEPSCTLTRVVTRTYGCDRISQNHTQKKAGLQNPWQRAVPGAQFLHLRQLPGFGPPRGLYHVLGQVVAKEHPGLSAAFETSGESKVTSKWNVFIKFIKKWNIEICFTEMRMW